ncbi:hypothetical protein SORBI_3008G027300 [Sorghum bicolor]|uniref:Rx N-terminal domain-containing protein n=1 Tax=Sorghum bicolor TaxID=4558 RepID=A0A1B6PB14_SORBI|nr:hypothetical protein SORBI_3008G027300 [Sorghum bicolor]
MWEVNSGFNITEVLVEDYSSLKQLTTQMGDDISQHLQIIESGLEEGGDIISDKENMIKAWLFCHEQRIRVLYGRTMELPLVVPFGLVDLARGAEFMSFNLAGELHICGCILAADSFINGLAHLKSLIIMCCRTSPSLSIGHLTSLESLDLIHLPDLCSLEGLSSWQLQYLSLIDVPNLTTKCISQFRVQQLLVVSSFVLLNLMLKAEGFIVPPNLILRYCNEASASFGECANLLSVKHLYFWQCKMEFLPGNLKFLSSLESLDIRHCPNITSLPVLPSSLQRISLYGCDDLRKNCREPDGESWPQISHIRWKHFD